MGCKIIRRPAWIECTWSTDPWQATLFRSCQRDDRRQPMPCRSIKASVPHPYITGQGLEAEEHSPDGTSGDATVPSNAPTEPARDEDASPRGDGTGNGV